MLNVATATRLDLVIADARGEIKYTKMPSTIGRRRKSAAWSASAPKGAFQHGSVPGAGSVTSGNKATVLASY